MKIEFMNESEWNEWDKKNKFEVPDEGQFEFKFKYVWTEEVTTRGQVIDACIQRMEQTDAFDDYDDINMEIKFKPDFDFVEVHISVRGLLR